MSPSSEVNQKERLLENQIDLMSTGISPIVVHDHMVMAHRLYAHIKEVWHSPKQGKNYESFVRACWALLINRGPDCLPMYNYRHIVVADQKKDGNYWRNELIQKDPRMKEVWENYAHNQKGDKAPEDYEQSYKGGRADKDPEWYVIEKIGWDYVTQFFPTFRHPGYEADDFMGAIARMSKRKNSVSGKRYTLLHSIDRDLTQLVDEKSHILWANTRYNWPNEFIQHRLAGDLEVSQHTYYKTGEWITHPKQLVSVKVRAGDMGDNLPVGTPYEYFDLLKPNVEFNVDKLPQIRALRKECNNPCPNTRTDHFFESLKVLTEAGGKNMLPYKDLG